MTIRSSVPPFAMTRVVLVMVMAMVLAGCQRSANTPDRPNILWIVSEDNSPCLGSYGDRLATTPRLDALAAEGIRLHPRLQQRASLRALAGRAHHRRVSHRVRHRAHAVRLQIPEEIQFYPHYLREAGYYTSNNAKKDYNTVDQPDAWDDSSAEASYRNRAEDQPFFHIANLGTTHESRLHRGSAALGHDPADVQLAPFHPDTPAARNDYAVYYDRLEELDGQVGETSTDCRRMASRTAPSCSITATTAAQSPAPSAS